MTIISNIEPPEGMEAYLDGGTVKFRFKAPDPATMLEVAHRVSDKVGERVLYEHYSGGVWSVQVAPAASAAGYSAMSGTSPVHRNPRHFTEVVVRIAHPSEAWVREGLELLEDYVTGYLAEAIKDNMDGAE